jgi:hypothetical protein
MTLNVSNKRPEEKTALRMRQLLLNRKNYTPLDGGGLQGEFFEERADFEEDFFGLGGGEGETQDALGRELRSAFGVPGDELHEARGIDGGGLGEADVELVALAVDLGDADFFAFDAEAGGLEQMGDAGGQRAVTVFELGADSFEGAVAVDAGDALVHAQALVFLGNVTFIDT